MQSKQSYVSSSNNNNGEHNLINKEDMAQDLQFIREDGVLGVVLAIMDIIILDKINHGGIGDQQCHRLRRYHRKFHIHHRNRATLGQLEA